MPMRNSLIQPSLLIALLFLTQSSNCFASSQYQQLMDTPESKAFDKYVDTQKTKFNPRRYLERRPLYRWAKHYGCLPWDRCPNSLLATNTFHYLYKLRYIQSEPELVGKKIYSLWLAKGTFAWEVVGDGKELIRNRYKRIYSPFSHYVAAACGGEGCYKENSVQLIWPNDDSNYWTASQAYCHSSNGLTHWTMPLSNVVDPKTLPYGTDRYKALQYLWVYETRENDSCIKANVNEIVKSHQDYVDSIKPDAEDMTEERINLLCLARKIQESECD